MSPAKTLTRDPRTVARDIPGIFDMLFPQLTPSIVTHFNRRAYTVANCKTISAELISTSALQPAMLFEIAVAASQQLINGSRSIDLDSALDIAINRQRQYFDAKPPGLLTKAAKKIVIGVAENLATMLEKARSGKENAALVYSPHIPGYQWIASGTGDFAIDSLLIEVKCTSKLFSSPDYRQVLMYWLLSYASSVEGGSPEWVNVMLINPRLDKVVEVSFDEMIKITGAGHSKIDVLQLFSSMVTDHHSRLLEPI